MNEIETLRKLLKQAMDAENYDKARHYMNMIEYLQEDEGEGEEPMGAMMPYDD